MTPVLGREDAEGEHLLLGLVHERRRFGEPAVEHVLHLVELGVDLGGRHLDEDGLEGGRHDGLMAFRDHGHEVAGEVHPTALVGRSLEAAPDGAHQAGVLVGDHETLALEPPGLEPAQELSPEDLVLRVTDIDAQDLSVPGGRHPGGRHPGGNDHRFGSDLVVLPVSAVT